MSDTADLVLSFGEVKVQFAYFLAMGFFFTLAAVGLFVLLCVETTFHQELRTSFKRPLTLLRRPKGAVIAFACWFICVSWLYNSALGSKFIDLRRTQVGGQVVWELGYHYPRRTVAIPDSEIHRWTGAIDWSRQTGRHSLALELKNGEVLISASLAPNVFKERTDQLARHGIVIPWGSGK